jgi:hypothetical protein
MQCYIDDVIVNDLFRPANSWPNGLKVKPWKRILRPPRLGRYLQVLRTRDDKKNTQRTTTSKPARLTKDTLRESARRGLTVKAIQIQISVSGAS